VLTLRKPLLRAPLFQLLAAAFSFSQSVAQEPGVPRASPEAQGFSSEHIAEATEFLASDSIDIHSLLLARRRALVLDAYLYPFDEGMLHDVASVTKSVVALATLMAVERGTIPSLDSSVPTRDAATEDRFYGRSTKAARKALPQSLWRKASLTLDAVDSAGLLDDLLIPPGNRLEALKGDRRGQHSIRINSQYRIRFRWTDAGPEDLEVVDHH
jgi:proteic killer suppression protein